MTKAIVLSFGDELISGQRVDTNSAWLSANLTAIGLPVVMHLTAGDDLETGTRALQFAGRNADVVVMTGGLGPTADDLTRPALAAATGHALELDEGALAHIQQIFASHRREMPARNRSQAMFPHGSLVVPNPHGTAPGIDLTTEALGNRTRFIALPGVPAEAQEMWRATVEPRLLTGQRTAQLIRSYTLKCFGAGESAVEHRLEDLMQRDREPLIGITVHQATISLRVTAKGTSEAECRRLADSTFHEIRARLGDLVFGEQSDELQDAVIRALAHRDLTLATLECDGQGWLVRWLKSSALRNGTSDVYVGGIVCSDSAALHELIDVQPSAAMDATSREFCRRAAESVRKQCNVSHALVVGAIPAAEDGRAIVNVGLATTERTRLFAAPFGGHPEVRGPRLSKTALNHLRLQLQK